MESLTWTDNSSDDLPLYCNRLTSKIVSERAAAGAGFICRKLDCQTVSKTYRYADEHHLEQFRKSGRALHHASSRGGVCSRELAYGLRDHSEQTHARRAGSAGVSKIRMAGASVSKWQTLSTASQTRKSSKFKSTQVARQNPSAASRHGEGMSASFSLAR